MAQPRASGVLLHPTSLPGPYGVGDFGPEASRFLDFLAGSGQSLWQFLPLNPIGDSKSPYQAYSAFAGNPLLISPERLAEAGLLPSKALLQAPDFPRDNVNFTTATRYKTKLLRQAYGNFNGNADFEQFVARQAAWLDDYALFMALKDAHKGATWNTWEVGLATRRPRALKTARTELASEVGFYKFVQYLFFQQQGSLKQEANARGIEFIGDIPIFVAHNSSDVWVNPHLFYLDRAGWPTVGAGVPPDYFSKTGQLWGNPLYRWDVMAEDGYAWWIDRLRMALALSDIVRIDHFRGLQAYWATPSTEKTAINGQWLPGPGAKFFKAVRQELGQLPIIAEDLGLITPDVERLRDRFGLAGMKVLQFAFSDPTNVYLPHNFTTTNCIVYTGTHDNNTNVGWWDAATPQEKRFFREYLGRRVGDVSWDLIQLALASTARLAIMPVQDLLSLDAQGRMNTPGTARGNWGWRFEDGALTAQIQRRLKDLTTTYGRAATLATPVEDTATRETPAASAPSPSGTPRRRGRPRKVKA